MNKRPQLSLDELHQLKWLLGGGLTLLAVSTVFYMDIDAWELMGLTFVATIACALWPTLPARVPPLAHLLAFPVIVAFFVGVAMWVAAHLLPVPAVNLAGQWRFLIAGGCAAFGFIVAFSGFWAFRQAKTTVSPVNPLLTPESPATQPRLDDRQLPGAPQRRSETSSSQSNARAHRYGERQTWSR